MQNTWLNPDYAGDHLVLLAAIILACLFVLPMVFGGLIYTVLGFVARLRHLRRDVQDDSVSDDEAEPQ